MAECNIYNYIDMICASLGVPREMIGEIGFGDLYQQELHQKALVNKKYGARLRNSSIIELSCFMRKSYVYDENILIDLGCGDITKILDTCMKDSCSYTKSPIQTLIQLRCENYLNQKYDIEEIPELTIGDLNGSLKVSLGKKLTVHHTVK